jgi:alkylhydroperoxidase family enzyme
MSGGPRIPSYNSADEVPTTSDEDRAALKHFFEINKVYSPQSPEHAANSWGLTLNNPQLAERLVSLSDYIVREMPWSDNKRARVLMVQTVNKVLKNPYSFMAWLGSGPQFGVSAEEMAALDFPDSDAFSDEDRVVIKFVQAAVGDGRVPDELFDQAKELFGGDKGMLEFAVAISYWSFWAILLNILTPNIGVGPFAERGGHAHEWTKAKA